MNILSLFDGMSCGQLALERAGIPVSTYFASEIDKHAIAVTMKNYPNTVQIGDVTNYVNWDLPSIDLLIGGSPCQGFSFAGKQLAFDDPRSQLFFDFVGAIKFFKPKYFLLENVRMKQEHLNVITNTLGVEPIVINSALVSAQNRVRYYWTNIPNVTIPEDRGITWGDVREHDANAQSYYYTEAALQWLAHRSRTRNKPLTTYADTDTDTNKMQMIEASHCKKYSNQRFFGVIDIPSDTQVVAALRGRYIKNGVRQDYKQLTAGMTKQYVEFRYDGKTNALTTVGKDNVVVPFTLPNRIPQDEFFFRYITPTECERLQTVPDGYTDNVSNTQRYRMLGNGWTVDVVAHIFKNIPI